jgi:hypothetical protein
MGLVLMLGIVLFIWWHKTRPFLAGAILIIPLAKPHLLSLFWIVLALWLYLRREKALLFGLLCGLCLASVLALSFDRHIFLNYVHMLQAAAIGREFIPALSGVLRLLFFHRLFWAQFAPLMIGIVWAIRFFLKHRNTWEWSQHGPGLLIVSVLVTPYEWISDETVLLPAILQAAALAYLARGRLTFFSKICIALFALMDFILLLILRSKVPFSTGIYFWSSLVWFFWYFCARSWAEKSSTATTAMMN